MKSQTFIDKALFTETVAEKRHVCSGCREAIEKGSPMFTKPFYYKHMQTGLTKLHNLNECWDEWSDDVAYSRIMAREIFEENKRYAAKGSK